MVKICMYIYGVRRIVPDTLFIFCNAPSMKKTIVIIVYCCLLATAGHAQNLAGAAAKFINSLHTAQKLKALYPFDIDERYNFNYVPLDNRKGIEMNALTDAQKAAAFDLLKTCLSTETVTKAKSIMMLDSILKRMENRKPDDHFRDTGKYFITIFGIPAPKTIWGWKLEGHHVAFNFYADKNVLVAGTPGFLGANPAVVQDGPQKGEQVLKDETAMGFALLHALQPEQLKVAVVDTTAPGEMITSNKRAVMAINPPGVGYGQLTPSQQQLFLQLVRLYVNRYTRLFANKMLKDIEAGGLSNLYFAWAGFTDGPGLGHPHYYRIQGPTLIIEYDNTQTNANHVHTVVRDLKHDFGGDLLLQHYRAAH